MKKLVLLTLVTMGLSISAHATTQEVFSQSVSGHGYCSVTYDLTSVNVDNLTLSCTDGSVGNCAGVDGDEAVCSVGLGRRRNSYVRGGINGGVNWLINNLDVAKPNSSSSNSSKSFDPFLCLFSLGVTGC